MSELLQVMENNNHLQFFSKNENFTTPLPARIFQGRRTKKDDLENPILVAIINKRTKKAMSFKEMEPRFKFEFRTNFAICKYDLQGVWVELSEISRIEHELYERTNGTFKIYSL